MGRSLPFKLLFLIAFQMLGASLAQDESSGSLDAYSPSSYGDSDYVETDTGVSCNSTMYNPCGAGTCVNQANTVTCICPRGYERAYRSSGVPLCYLGANVKIYEVQPLDTCYLIATTFRMTIADLIANNPTLDCSAPLPKKKILNVVPIRRVRRCRTYYTVQAEDTCASIEKFFKLRTNSLKSLNPSLNCTNLVTYQTVCIQQNPNTEKSFMCAKYAPSKATSTCQSLARENGLSLFRLFLLNQGLTCKSLGLAPKKICKLAVPRSSLKCVKRVYVSPGDTCQSIIRDSYSGSRRKFRRLNKGFVCDDYYLYVGLSLC